MTQTYRTLRVTHSDEGVLSVVIDAPPMNLIGPELVRDLVTLIGELESDQESRVMVLESADPDYFVPHVDPDRSSTQRVNSALLVPRVGPPRPAAPDRHRGSSAVQTGCWPQPSSTTWTRGSTSPERPSHDHPADQFRPRTTGRLPLQPRQRA